MNKNGGVCGKTPPKEFDTGTGINTAQESY
jgi:hypothetical protein